VACVILLTRSREAILPAILSESFLRALPESERRRLGRAGFTREESTQAFIAGEERKLKKLVTNYLNMRGVWFFEQRMDRRTRGRRGVPDILACICGRFVAIELKVAGSKLSAEQEREGKRIEECGGRFLIVRRLEDVIAELSRVPPIVEPG
jgi:hypothetical protein